MTILLNNINSFIQNDVLTLLLIVIWFFSISLILSILLNKKQGEMYILSFIVSSFLLFIGGIVNRIIIFYYFGWILIIFCIAYLVIKKRINFLLTKIDISSSLIFIFIILILFILYENKGFAETDEFMHWGPMVREMFRLNKFFCVPESTLIVHKDYPPFFSLIELLFCYFKGEYRECYLYIALLGFYFSIAVAVSSKKNNLFEKIFIILIFTLLGFSAQELFGTIIEEVTIYITIYIDYFLATYAAYILYYELVLDSNTISDKAIRILYISGLLLSKQIAIVFYLLYLIILFIKRKIDIYSIFLPLVCSVMWKMIVSLYNITGQFSIANVSFRGNAFNIINKFVTALISRPIFAKPVPCSFVFAVLIVIGLFIIFSKRNKSHILIYFIGLCLYTLTLMLLYSFVFSIDEAETLASFERYMYTYVLFGMSYIILLISYSNYNKGFYLFSVLVLLLMADFNNSNIYKITDYKDIFVVKQWGEPIVFNNDKDNGYVLNFKIKNYIKNDIDYNELTKEISNFHYLYVYLYDDNFYNYWVDYTGDYGLENDSVFYIANNNENITYSKDNFTKVYFAIKYYLEEKMK